MAPYGRELTGVITEVTEMEELLAKGQAQLLVTGAMVNLLNLRPEICTLLLIRDAAWYEQHDTARNGRHVFKRNWEFKNDEELRDRQRTAANGRLFWRQRITSGGTPLDDTTLASIFGDFSASSFVVPGAITFWLGVERLRRDVKLLNGRGDR